MDYYALTDKAILSDLGSRLRSLRIRKNVTQEALAEMTLLSLGTIKSLEVGKAKLSTIIAVLREMDALHELDNFILQPTVSPLEIAANKSKVRVRAGRNRLDDETELAEKVDW